ncbi:MAG: LemA family protein [Aquihabitans sp.]
MAILLVLIVIVVILVIIFVVMYNGLVALKNKVEAAWAQIDVQLTRRSDLIPNLVETVKGYAAHERETLDAVIKARNMAQSATGPAEAAAADNMLTGALKSVFALSEAYPDLKANQNFLALQEELTGTEDKIAYSRQFYNSSIQTLNSAAQSFPTNLIAGMAGVHPRPYFEAVGEERADVNVRF